MQICQKVNYHFFDLAAAFILPSIELDKVWVFSKYQVQKYLFLSRRTRKDFGSGY